MNPLVSIVIPVYNSEKFIDKGLNSIIDQTYKNIEIICVDNNSMDNSVGVLRSWEQKYPNLKVIEEKRQGAPFARNRGTNEAKGEWIQYFDIDDYLYPNKIEHQINLINNNVGDVDIVFEGWEVSYLNGEIRQNEVLYDDVWKGLFNGRIGNTNSVLIQKSKIMEIGGWDESLKSSQERNLYFSILKTNPRYIISYNIGSRYIMREGSITTTAISAEGNTLRFVKLRGDILNFLLEIKPDYFQLNKKWYLSLFLEKLRWIYKYNPLLSAELFEKYCKNEELEPIGSLSKKYLLLLRIFGFRQTEKIYSLTK